MTSTTRSVLTSEHIEYLRRNGFLALERLASLDEVERLKSIFKELFDRRAGRDRGMHFDLAGTDEDDHPASLPQIMNPSQLRPALLKSEFMANARSIALQLLGPDADFAFDHALLKPASTGAGTPWHQDEAFSDPFWDLNQMSFWMPLQDATLENGCLHFIPGSHKGEVLPHRSYKDDPKIHALECVDGFDPESAVACPIPAGGVTIHTPRTLHSAGPNLTDQPRFAYVVVFGAPSKPHPTPRQFPWLAQRHTARQERESRWIKDQGWLGAVSRKVRRKANKARNVLRSLKRRTLGR
jgi:ectoine hydroxylase-related dioxygenase (phytanoyl-CoA dioxygenase family)